MVITYHPEQIVATDVSAEEYMEKYAANFCEWVDGIVIKMSPIHDTHDLITQHFVLLFRLYFSYRPTGKIKLAPFVMKLEKRREPDLQIILNDNPHQLMPTYMDGPADICIEIVSPGSEETDYGSKFVEYEKGGVKEYWIFDPSRKESRFHRLNDESVYIIAQINGIYQTPLLPELQIDTSVLWSGNLPEASEIVELIKQMLGE